MQRPVDSAQWPDLRNLSEIKSDKKVCIWCEEFQTRTQAYRGSRMTQLLVDLLNFL